MKLISLNTWGGRAGKEKLLDFFEKHKDIDIFCLQEIWAAPYEHFEGAMAGGSPVDHSKIMTEGLQEITKLFTGFTPYFRPHFGDNYGLLILVKKNVNILSEGEIFVHRQKGYMPEKNDLGHHARNIQFITTTLNDKPLTVINFHGLWNGLGKGDSSDRLNQSQKILDFIKTLEGSVVLCGDFNLLPNTESIGKIEKSGLINLIKKYNVASTRSSYYLKPEKFADYTFISPEIKVNDFKVLPDEVSDHLAMYLDFE